MEFAINCRESSFHLISISDTNFVVNEISLGESTAREGILTEAPILYGQHHLYHVEIDDDVIIYLDVRGSSGMNYGGKHKNLRIEY